MPIRSLAARAAAFLVLLTVLALPAAAQTVTVGDATAACGGSNFNVPITVQSASGMLSLEFRVSYDPARMTFNSASTGSMTSGFTMSSNASGSSINIAMASGTPVSGNGTAATLSFKPAATFTAGDVTMSLSQLRINDVTVTGRTGTVHLTCAPPTPVPQAPTLTSPSNNATGVDAPVRLRWNAAANATSYRVYFGTSPSPEFLATSSNTNETVTTAPSTKYFWRVRAVNDAGTSDSPVFSFTTGASSCAVIPAPEQLKAEPQAVASGTPIRLSWSASVQNVEYLVDEARDAGFAGATTTTTTDTSLSVTRTVDVETTFFFRVRTRAANSCGTATSDPSSTVSVRVTPQSAPPPTPIAHAFLVIVGSGPGANGSFFHTALQLHNPSNATMSGRLVFHRAGTPGSANDPSIEYSLPPSSTKSFADIVTALGTTGFGSLDIVPSSVPPVAPLTAVRIYNDGGAVSGSNGMTLEPLTAGDAVQAGQRTVLFAPTQPSAMRLNIGVRTLGEGATLRLTVSDRNGVAIGNLTRTFPADYFEQLPLSGLVAAASLTGDEVVAVHVEAGSALVYGATTDNVTQDPAIQIGRPL